MRGIRLSVGKTHGQPAGVSDNVVVGKDEASGVNHDAGSLPHGGHARGGLPGAARDLGHGGVGAEEVSEPVPKPVWLQVRRNNAVLLWRGCFGFGWFECLLGLYEDDGWLDTLGDPGEAALNRFERGEVGRCGCVGDAPGGSVDPGNEGKCS